MSNSIIKEFEKIFNYYQNSVVLLDKYAISKGFLHSLAELQGYRIINIKNDGNRLDITVKCIKPGYQSKRERMSPIVRTITFANGFSSAECEDIIYKHEILPSKSSNHSKFESEYLPCRL
jgi:hypothetical protein